MSVRLALSIIVSIVAYGVCYVARREFDILTAYGLIDWLILLLFALAPVAANRDSSAPALALAVVVTALCELGLTVLIIVWLFPSHL
jgi:hypothetical protein